MAIVLNIGVILLILLAAYWWGSQGLFSSLLHLVATIAAGAVTFAIWEPIVYAILDGSKNKALLGITWGSTLLICFTLLLVAFRVLLDKLIPNNLNLPHWADLSVGGALGWASGTVSMGIIILGFSFMQSKPDIMGYYGTQRHKGDGNVKLITGMWYPAHVYTGKLYERLSLTSFATGSPMGQVAPELSTQSSLFRDTASKGKASSVLRPGGARLATDAVSYDPEKPNRMFVSVEFLNEGYDFGGQLTVTSAQVRLIEAPTSRSAPARVVYPAAWHQEHQKRDEEGKNNWHQFNTISAVVTSEGTRAPLSVTFEFDTPANFSMANGRRGAAIQIKGVRYELPRAQPSAAGPAMLRQMTPLNESVELEAGANIDDLVVIRSSIPGLNASANLKPGGITLSDENYIARGKGTFAQNQGIVSRELKIKGFLEVEGEPIVQVNITRGGLADVFTFVEQGEVKIDDEIYLVDERGQRYYAIGLWSKRGGSIEVEMRPADRIPRVELLPRGSISGTEELWLAFRVVEGTRITGLKAGDLTIGTISKTIQAVNRRR